MKFAARGKAIWPALCTWPPLVLLLVVGLWSGGRHDGPEAGTGHATDRLRVGRVCRSTLPPGMELSCGTYGFGDMRYVCTADSPEGRLCDPTTQVTVRNAGRSVVYVTCIGGPRQGVRQEGPQQALAPGRKLTLRPGSERWLFDITLRGSGGGPGTIQVVGVH